MNELEQAWLRPRNIGPMVVSNLQTIPIIREDTDTVLMADKVFPKGMTQSDSSVTESEEYTGGSSSYYQLHIKHPKTEGQAPFDVECLDIVRALEMDAELFNIFKAAWRIAAGRKGRKKKGNTEIYDLDKIIFFATELKTYLEKVDKE